MTRKKGSQTSDPPQKEANEATIKQNIESAVCLHKHDFNFKANLFFTDCLEIPFNSIYQHNNRLFLRETAHSN